MQCVFHEPQSTSSVFARIWRESTLTVNSALGDVTYAVYRGKCECASGSTSDLIRVGH